MRLANIALVACVTLTGCDGTDGETVGPRGGTVVSADGRLSLEIAEGALSHDVDITIDQVDCTAMHLDALGPCYEVGPRGTGFLFPARLTLELEAADLDDAGDRELGLWAQREATWNLLADRDFDAENGTLTASATYLSSFAVVALPDDDDDRPRPQRR